MKFAPLPLRDAYRIEIEPFRDQRGSFSRICCRNELAQIGHQKEFVQINYSFTQAAGAVRGMHFQYPPKAETKMVKCLRGKVFDVIIDIRKDSDSFLQWYGEILSEKNNYMMYIPEGFAHGFQTLQPDTALLYFHTEFYDPQYEGGLRYNDPVIDVRWPEKISDISERDANHPMLKDDFQGVEL
jgi:dTDP-4-dehydrorhamnose 3,5-epimerase